MKVHEVYDHIVTRPYAEDDYLLNTFIDETMRRVSWKLFEHQNDILYMANETETGIPVLKDNALETMRDYISGEFSWIRSYIITHLLMSYRLGNIDLGLGGEWWLREELGEEEYLEWESRARKAIYQEYAQNLGEDKAAEYFKKIGRFHYKDGNVDDLKREDNEYDD